MNLGVPLWYLFFMRASPSAILYICRVKVLPYGCRIYFLVCDERPSLHIKFERPSCWLELLSRLVNISNKLRRAWKLNIRHVPLTISLAFPVWKFPFITGGLDPSHIYIYTFIMKTYWCRQCKKYAISDFDEPSARCLMSDLVLISGACNFAPAV